MAWIILVLSGVLEAVWATALGRSAGFTNRSATIVFGVALVFSMLGLAQAMKTLPTGTAYAVWVGIGASLTVLYAMYTGTEPVTLARAVFLSLIIIGIIGLKVAT